MISCDPQARASSDSLISLTSTNSLPYTILFILEDYFILPCSFQDAVLIRGQATLIVSYYFFLSLRDFSCGVGVCHSFWMLIFKISVSTLKHTDYMRILFVILMHSGQACFMWFWNFPFVPHVEVCLGDAAADSVQDLFLQHLQKEVTWSDRLVTIDAGPHQEATGEDGSIHWVLQACTKTSVLCIDNYAKFSWLHLRGPKLGQQEVFQGLCFSITILATSTVEYRNGHGGNRALSEPVSTAM